MHNYQNHVVDPTWFWDAIEEFAFDYDWFIVGSVTTDELFRDKYTYTKDTIHGSLQSQGTSVNLLKTGNTESMEYEFYCASIYRIKVNDFILYKNRWLHVESVRDIDEFGVRSARLKMVNLNNYNDLLEYVKYLDGEILV